MLERKVHEGLQDPQVLVEREDKLVIREQKELQGRQENRVNKVLVENRVTLVYLVRKEQKVLRENKVQLDIQGKEVLREHRV